MNTQIFDVNRRKEILILKRATIGDIEFCLRKAAVRQAFSVREIFFVGGTAE